MRWYFCLTCNKAFRFKDQSYVPKICPICKGQLMKEMEVR